MGSTGCASATVVLPRFLYCGVDASCARSAEVGERSFAALLRKADVTHPSDRRLRGLAAAAAEAPCCTPADGLSSTEFQLA